MSAWVVLLTSYNSRQQSALLAILNHLTQRLRPKSTAQYLSPWMSVCAQECDLNRVALFPSTARWASYDLYTEFCHAGWRSAMFLETSVERSSGLIVIISKCIDPVWNIFRAASATESSIWSDYELQRNRKEMATIFVHHKTAVKHTKPQKKATGSQIDPHTPDDVTQFRIPFAPNNINVTWQLIWNIILCMKWLVLYISGIYLMLT